MKKNRNGREMKKGVKRESNSRRRLFPHCSSPCLPLPPPGNPHRSGGVEKEERRKKNG